MLRVAITADPYLPVPPAGYGGIERVIDVLVRGLVARGHVVTLMAHPDSVVPASIIPYGVPPHAGTWRRLAELGQVGAALVTLARRVDIVHSFGRLAALLPILPLRSLPKIQTYQRKVPWAGVRRASRVAGNSLRFTACSTTLYAGGARGESWSTVYNPVDPAVYTEQRAVPADAPLMFLGRLEPIKGAHAAIAIARQCGRALILAGNAPDRAYFDTEIAPWLGRDGISWVGEVDDAAKNALLGRAAALLMPVDWEEPFGIVMIEAMACGTPVIGYARGAVPEVVTHGVTGFVVEHADEAARAVAALPAIDRGRCRAEALRRFAAEVIVSQYEQLYFDAVGA